MRTLATTSPADAPAYRELTPPRRGRSATIVRAERPAGPDQPTTASDPAVERGDGDLTAETAVHEPQAGGPGGGGPDGPGAGGFGGAGDGDGGDHGGGDHGAGGSDGPSGDGGGRGGAPTPAGGLFRSRSDRMLFGVSGGIAQRYGFEPVLIRVLFLGSIFLGGAGLLFYLAAAILIPEEPVDVDGVPSSVAAGTASASANAAGGVLRLLLGIAAVFGILVGFGIVAACSFAVTALLGAWPVAVILAILAVALVGARQNRRAASTLLVVILAFALPAASAVVADIDVDRSIGERTYRPFDATRARDGYRLGVGEMTVDLRQLPLRRDSVLRVPARVDVGRLNVLLPRNRCVAWSVDTRMTIGGDTRVLSRHSSDNTALSNHRESFEIDPGKDRPQVNLDLRVGVGELFVTRNPADLDGHGRFGNWRWSGPNAGADPIRTDACRKSRSARG
ncbi:PspC domain-containing protein [Patulibacter defluvii]|uniref:PspC domain-containing protein n=1 Tax=Patulibacter defluvii TaxID=3095358 RepID=UPI002A75F91E|nr:PspC domain-containing protein [Patulibacter sp. DM4]